MALQQFLHSPFGLSSVGSTLNSPNTRSKDEGQTPAFVETAVEKNRADQCFKSIRKR